MIELRTFGTLELTSDGRSTFSAVLAQPRRTALLCYLALGSPRGFRSRDTLYSIFWPEHGAEQARHALRQALYFLRHHLGADAIISQGDGRVGLSPDRVACDAAKFEALLSAGQPEEALALYVGELLPGFHVDDAPEFERWLEVERSRLQRRAAEAAWALAGAREREGDPAAAVEWGRRAADFSPADETVLRRLLLLLDRLGDRAAALRAYETFALGLEREYELQPSRETLELVAALRAGGPRNGAATTPAAPTRGRDPTAANATTASEPERPGRAVSSTTAADLSDALRRSTPGTPMPAPLDDAPTPLAATPDPHTSRRRQRVIRYAAAALVLCAVLLSVLWPRISGRHEATLAVQDEIARTVARELDRRFGSVAVTPPQRARTRNVAAYELYRRGSDRSRLRSDSAAREGMELLQQAIARDSTYAAAWAGLALMSHRVGLTLPPAERRQYWRRANEAARRAVSLDDSLAEGHLMLGKVLMTSFDFAEAERELTHAISLDPTLSEPHELLVKLYLWTERTGEALAHAERAVTLDPLSASAHAERARALVGLDRCDHALVALDTLAKLNPPLLRAADIAAHCYARKGMWSAAIAVHGPGKERGLPPALAQTAYMLASAGQRDEALRIHTALLEAWRRGEEGAFHVGLVYAGLGDLDEAVAWFERAVADGSLHAISPGNHLLMLPGPLADDLRRHPRFPHLRERLGLPTRTGVGGGAGELRPRAPGEQRSPPVALSTSPESPRRR